MNQVRIFVIPNYRIFAPNFLNFKITFTLIIFQTFVASKVFTITFCCAIPRQFPISDITHPYDGVKYVSVALTVVLWYHVQYGSLWVLTSAFINILPGYGNISITFKNSKGEVFLIAVSWFGHLVGVYGNLLNSRVYLIHCVSSEWVYNNYLEFTDPIISVSNDT